jgi:pyruvate formate lyase activating enzyme
MVMEAAWYEKLENGSVRCLLCPQGCVIAEGASGLCLGRVNEGGRLQAATYARPASVAMDPIEKKPLYHFFPGSEILSVGTYGCNLRCSYCQNCTLSQEVTPTQELLPRDAAQLASGRESIGIAYTYNEPSIWFEYIRDTGALVREAGLKNILVSNGFINPGPLEELLPLIDAMNIDIKSFRDTFYKDICNGRLQPVLDTARAAAGACHVEITNLVIPGHNDDPSEQDELAAWIAENLGRQTPLHLSAYFPRYKLQAAPTAPEALFEARERFSRRLDFVYLGNLRGADGGITHCPQCNAEAIDRDGYTIRANALGESGACAGCGADLNIIN